MQMDCLHDLVNAIVAMGKWDLLYQMELPFMPVNDLLERHRSADPKGFETLAGFYLSKGETGGAVDVLSSAAGQDALGQAVRILKLLDPSQAWIHGGVSLRELEIRLSSRAVGAHDCSPAAVLDHLLASGDKHQAALAFVAAVFQGDKKAQALRRVVAAMAARAQALQLEGSGGADRGWEELRAAITFSEGAGDLRGAAMAALSCDPEFRGPAWLFGLC